MSLNGLFNNQFPLTLDGTQSLDASSISIDGVSVDISNLVPYTGATQTLDMGTQNIKTSHTPVANEDVINLITLQNAVTFVDNSIALTYLNKITSNDQTVAGKVTYTKELAVTNEKPVTLGNQVVVGPNYPISTVSSATVTVSQHFGSITNSGGVYQATTDIASGTPILIGFPITNGKKYRFTVEFLVEDPTYTWYIDAYQSVDGITPVTFGVLGFTLIPANTSAYTTLDYTFDAVTTGNVIFPVTNDASPTISNKAVKWKDLVVFEQGVALAKVTIPSLTADRVAVFDESHRLVSSGINVTKLGYLDNVSSDIQTQLNAKLNLSGSNANQNIVLGSYKVQSSATPSTGDDYINLTYGNATYALASALASYLPLSGGTMTGNISMGSFKVTSNATPTASTDYVTKAYGDSTYALSSALSGYLPLTGGTLSGPLTISSGALTAHTRLLGVPDASTGGYFWLGLTGSDTEENRLAISIIGDQVSGTCSGVAIAKPLTVQATETITISGASASTTAFQVLSTSANHYDGNPSTTYLMSGLSGYITLADGTTRTNTDACMMLGTNGDLSEVTSVTTDGSGLKPLNFGGSSFLFTGGGGVEIRAKGGSNPSTNGLYVFNTTNEAGQDAIVTVRSGGSSGGNPYISFDVAGEAGWSWGMDNSDNKMKLSYSWSSLTSATKWTVNTDGSLGINASPDYMLDVNGSGRIRGSFYVGTFNNVSSQIYFGGVSGDGDYNHTVIECRKYDEAGEGSELLLFKGNDPTTGGLLADRVRLRGAEICFDTYDYFTTDRAREDIRMTIVGDGRVGIGTRTPGSLLDIYSTGYSYNTSLRVRTDWAGIQLASSGSGGRTWNMFSTVSGAGIGAGRLGIYDETAGQYRMWLKENGAVCINNSTSVLVGNDYMAGGSLSIGNINQNYGGGSGWTSNTAGLLLECADNTEIAIHDSGTRVMSALYYQGAQNFISIGRDMGWGAIGYVLVPSSLIANRISVVADDANGRLNVRNPNGSNTHFGYSDNRNYIRNNTIFDTGYVEIGGSYVWRAPLDITTSVSRDNGCVRYFDVNTNGIGYTCGWSSYSAMADTWGGARFMAYSDIRKKKNIKTVSTALKDIQGLRIVSYDHIDHVQPHNYWGVIAQEIEEQYPYLISQGKEFLPNIFIEALAHQCSKCGDFVWLEMTVLVDSNHVGKLVKIITYDEEGKTEYEETTTIVAVEDFRMKVKVWKKQDEVRYESKERVFVYGTCEEDVRTVDKTQFGLLAVAGVQEQQKMIEEQRKRLAVLETREAVWEQYAREQEAKQKKMEERMEKMASLLSQLMNV